MGLAGKNKRREKKSRPSNGYSDREKRKNMHSSRDPARENTRPGDIHRESQHFSLFRDNEVAVGNETSGVNLWERIDPTIPFSMSKNDFSST